MSEIYWWYLCSAYAGTPAESGPAHLTEHLPAYILESALELNPSLTRSSEVITHFSTIDTIKRFFILSSISHTLYHGDSVTFWLYIEPMLLIVNEQHPVFIISGNRATWSHVRGNIVHLWVKSQGISNLTHIGWLWLFGMLLRNNPDVSHVLESGGYLLRL